MRIYFLLPLAAALLSGHAASAQSHFFASNRGMVALKPFVPASSRSSRDDRLDEAMLRPERREAVKPRSLTENDAPVSSRAGDRPTVPGRRAVLRRGVAYAPADAPQHVKELIWAVNKIRRHPYKWGGGHGSFYDNGYDCSGAVSYALHQAGALSSPMTSRDLQRWGQRGRGRWVTVYARNGHTFAVIAGLRLDAMGEGLGGPRWHADMRPIRGFEARTAVGL